MRTVRAILEHLRLPQYGDIFEELGYDDHVYLVRLGRDELLGVAAAAKMKPGHAGKFADLFASSAAAVLSTAGGSGE